MKIFYRKIKNEIEIIRCYGDSPDVVIPEQIENLPVVRIAPYTFSDRKRQEDIDVLSCEISSTGLEAAEKHLLAGTEIESVYFPETVREIGNYIFYGCKQLKKLEFFNPLLTIGSGAFTGCGSIKKLSVHMTEGNKSCVKEILGDLWQRIDVSFHYEKTKERSELVFPEHYEEAVENTPARILFTQHHGSGNNYRQCFYNKEIDYRKYDSLFYIAEARDRIENLIDMAFGRLKFPYGLGEEEKEQYCRMIKERYEEIIPVLVKEERMEDIRIITELSLWDEKMLDLALDLSAGERKPELSGYFMSRRKKSGRSRKRFEL